MQPRATSRLLAVLAAAVVALTACGPSSGSTDPAPLTLEVPTVPAGTTPLPEGGAWWASGVLHVGDRALEVGPVRSFAVADRTVAYVDGDDRVCLSDLERTACSDLQAYGDLVVAPDGSHLGFLESSLGGEDSYGQHVLTTIVVDLTTGDVVLRSTAGMGDPDSDDLGALYPDAGPLLEGFTADGDVVVEPASSPVRGDLVLPLGGGEPAPAARRGDVVLRDLPGSTVRVDVDADAGTVEVRPGRAGDSTVEGHRSPDGAALAVGPMGYRQGLRAAPAPRGLLQPFTGQQEAWWAFGVWSGPHAFLATTLDRRQTTYRVYRCDAVTRVCAQRDRLPTGDLSIFAVLFPTVVGSDVVSLSASP